MAVAHPAALSTAIRRRNVLLCEGCSDIRNDDKRVNNGWRAVGYPNETFIMRLRNLLNFGVVLVLFIIFTGALHAQSLLNLDFRGDSNNVKLGFAATGKTTNDYWNVVSFPWQNLGTVGNLKSADGTDTTISATLANGGGYWFNSTGDPMFDGYVYPNGGGGDGVGNLTVTVSNLTAGRYDVYLYGNAYPHPGDPTSRGECDTIFSASSGGNNYGPTGTTL